MSTNLTLIKYELGAKDRYLEDSAEPIASSFVSEKTLGGLVSLAPLAKLTIYEEEGSDEFSEADCLQNEKIGELFDFIKAKFIDLLKTTDISDIEKSNEKIGEAVSEFRSIANLYYLLEIKYTKYQFDDTAIVKLG